MSYQVIARKWRPQSFGDVVFQEHVSQTLQNSIVNNRISHAYLFSGPRGVGKTTMARILAMALDCVEGPTAEPCGICENCREIKSGVSFDVIEIDGASNNGVEDIRELRENVNFAPVKGKYKVYIIDEVHMVTTQAFNALLKTLEEPPPHVVFIFATTEYHKIPETILSRCQKFFFKRIPVETIVAHLKVIAEKEGVKISDAALYPIARAADGAMRDAQSLLDQVISFSPSASGKGKEITISEEDALTILGIVPVESYIILVEAICRLDAVAVIEEIDRIVSMGVDIPRYVAGLFDIFRTLRLIMNKVALKNLLELSPEEMEKLQASASMLCDEELSRFYRIAVDLQGSLRFSNNERINLEMALLDMIAVKKTPSLTSIITRLESGDALSGPAGAAPQDDSKKKVSETSPPEKKNVSPDSVDVEALWGKFMASLSSEKPFLRDILKPARARLEGNRLMILYPGGEDHSYYHRVLDQEKREYICSAFSKKLGYPINVEIGLSKKEDFPAEIAQRSADAGKPAGGDTSAGAEPKAEKTPSAVSNETEENQNNSGETADPTVEKIKNIFHGEIIEKGDSI